MLGAPLDSVTVLHYAEAIADIPDKRRVSYEQPMRDERGCKVWRRADELDSNGILDCFALEGAMDAVETIARAYATKGRHRTGSVGQADCHLFDAQGHRGFRQGLAGSAFSLKRPTSKLRFQRRFPADTKRLYILTA